MRKPGKEKFTKPLFCESRFGAVKNVHRSFEAIGANRLKRYEDRGLSANYSRESIRANRPDSRCEPLGHPRSKCGSMAHQMKIIVFSLCSM